VTGLRQETDDLQQRANQLRDQVNRQRDAALGDEAARLRALEASVGAAAVRGNALLVRLVDAPPTVDPVTGQANEVDLGKIQDRDLQRVVNQLWRDGAEAIAINGQRLTATSTIRAAGGAIVVDFRPLSSPYDVVAIGPQALDKRFNASATAQFFRQLARQYQLRIQVKATGDQTVPAAPQLGLHYAQPVAPPAGPSGQPSSANPSTPGGP
jgi:uncharacterized protein YlxW (UPF0749 family)